MSDPITPARLAEIEARCNAATKGPWAVYPTPVSLHGGVGEEGSYEAVFEDRDVAKEDADFIAASRTDIPDLLAALRAAWEEREALRRGMEIIRDGDRERGGHCDAGCSAIAIAALKGTDHE